MSAPAKPMRCAIYTRKSSDEGLEQAFNSLEAQREACEAYVASQGGEGWELAPDRYDDGGYSGGSMERPALRRLLDDVRARRLDAVLVYKVDRLTRSLADFARIVEVLEKHGASFVSITQAFNTTTSMGRLTLNVLLSFAQFEREVTSERIRDKIAASKAKGMWMGGLVPLGYDPPVDDSRALIVNQDEAATVRFIFAWYIQLGSLLTLQTKLDEEGVRSKARISTRGRPIGGCRFSRGALRHLLANRIYLGEICHAGAVHQGRHPAILDRRTFEAAQAILGANSRRRRTHVSRAGCMLLNGLLFDTDGFSMEPVFGQKARTQRYAYYASRSDPRGALGDDPDDAIRRVPAYAIDELVGVWSQRLLSPHGQAPTAAETRKLVERVVIHPWAVHMVIRTAVLPGKPGLRSAISLIRECLSPSEQALPDPARPGLVRIVLSVRMVVRGGRTWFCAANGRPVAIPKPPNPALVRQLRSGHRILRRCAIDPETISPARSARAPRSARERKLAELGFLAPDIQRAIFAGEIASVKADRIPLSWAEQRRMFVAGSSMHIPAESRRANLAD